MTLIILKNGSISLNEKKILNVINFTVHKKEKICILGKNGEGKSTFLKILSKKITLDHGKIEFKKKIKISYLSQNLPKRNNKSVYQFICEKIHKKYKILLLYHELTQKKLFKKNQKNIQNIENLLNQYNLWKLKNQIDEIIIQLNLNKNLSISELSGGTLKKVLLAKKISQTSDILLLDEPTNHLDIITIEWLEKFLKKFSGSVLFVSHDRLFINKVSTKIVDLDRGNLTVWNTKNYEDFLIKKKKFLDLEKEKNKKLKKKFEKEMKWKNTGIKARGIRNIGKIKKLEKTKKEIEKKIEFIEKPEFIIQEKKFSRKIILTCKKITISQNKKKIIKNFSHKILYGDKIALIGKNGSGKSTILKSFLKKIPLYRGILKFHKNTEIQYFDQERKKIKLNKTVLNNISNQSDHIIIHEKFFSIKKILKSFLFPPEKINVFAKTLSGGEKNKLLFAKIFLKPSNFLILDEPTNDLDISSLNSLENSLKKYSGTIIFTSHDRRFINNVANQYWYIDHQKNIQIYYNNFEKNYKKIIKSIEYKKILKKIPQNKTKSYTIHNHVNKKKIRKENKKKLEKIKKLEKKIQKEYEKTYEKKFYKQENHKIKNQFKKIKELKQKIELLNKIK